MTSWTPGRENEDSGERQMNNDDLGDKVQGAGKVAAGKIEQGVDNVADWAAGRQDDLDGDTSIADRVRTQAGSMANDASSWAENRADDVNNDLDNNNRNN